MFVSALTAATVERRVERRAAIQSTSRPLMPCRRRFPESSGARVSQSSGSLAIRTAIRHSPRPGGAASRATSAMRRRPVPGV